MRVTRFSVPLKDAIAAGLSGIALVDRNGEPVELAGTIDPDEAGPLAAYVMYRLRQPDLAARLFDGEILTLSLETRMVCVTVAKRQLFVVATFPLDTSAPHQIVRELREHVEILLPALTVVSPTLFGDDTNGSGGSGPAHLPLTLRERGKA